MHAFQVNLSWGKLLKNRLMSSFFDKWNFISFLHLNNFYFFSIQVESTYVPIHCKCLNQPGTQGHLQSLSKSIFFMFNFDVVGMVKWCHIIFLKKNQSNTKEIFCFFTDTDKNGNIQQTRTDIKSFKNLRQTSASES